MAAERLANFRKEVFMLYYGDIYYLILVVPALIIAMIAQAKVQSAYTKYEKVRSARGYTAKDITRRILDDNGLSDIRIERVAGNLTDHYDPRAGVIRLSDSVMDSTSVAAIGVAAHEAGHAVQRKEDYYPIKLRNTILPVAQFASGAAIPLALIGFIFGAQLLVSIGIILFAATVLFQVVTLPVEFDASKRAMQTLRESGYLEGEELSGAKKVLTAAAMTYVASALVSLMNLLRLVLLSRNRRD